MKIWQKTNTVHSTETELTQRFTVGNDREFDMLLAEYDVLGSLAHAQMLNEVGILTDDEFQAVSHELRDILRLIRTGAFEIADEVEDIHSQVEWMLISRIGDAGKKIHTGRSRNDQVATDIKLYLRAELKNVSKLVFELFDLLQQLSEQHQHSLLPGYTHLQIAMPSSFGLWFGAYAESLTDDMEWIEAAYKISNRNPLGSGAGYGSSFPLNRQRTTELLGFERMNYNSAYAQMTRGKTEKSVACALSAVASTLSKLAYDVCLYINQNFAFISFPETLTTGSSIMPHKKNPDIFELVRAKCNRIQSVPNELTLLLNNLPSGYHRDVQLTKEVLFPAILELKECLQISVFALRAIEVRTEILSDKMYENLFTVDRVNKLVMQGKSFRDAYVQVAQEVKDGSFVRPANMAHTHEGSLGNLCTAQIAAAMTGFRYLAE